ncbi:AfsR/SARP family transcriptional regulator, partial [Nocardiopsis coralliicola]
MQPSHDALTGVRSGSEIAFDVLGPVTAQAGTVPIALRGDKRRSLLAALLLRSDRGSPVATADLARILWGAATSAEARRGALQVQVARLRAALGAEHGARLITGSAGGYRIELGPDQLDLLRMRRTTAEAAAAESSGDPRRAFRLLRRALRLWKGPIAAGARTPVLEDEDVRPLEDELLTAAEHWGALGLRLGRADSCLEDLGRIAGRHPERERLVEIQMRALHRAGRRGDALELFGRTRRALAQRLGLDPGRSLQRTFEGVLRGTLAEPGGTAARSGPAGRARSAPAQPPEPPSGLVGRSAH